MSTIISQIRAYRNIRNMTQQDLAKRLGVSKRTIVTLEGKSCSPSLLLAYNIAKLFYCAVEDVFVYQKR